MDLKELSRLIKTCRSLGVEHIKYGDIELKLSDLPTKPKRQSRMLPQGLHPMDITESTRVDTDELSAEELLLYSVGVENNE